MCAIRRAMNPAEHCPECGALWTESGDLRACPHCGLEEQLERDADTRLEAVALPAWEPLDDRRAA
ncbi:MAG TPA: hypothetical protein PK668_17230 [Myxococcota bacterium]|nr:hypothetical protein [Myxococcota bacterium]HRY94903.1 hypothetical protein [Myxococcota bacterium]HSA21819.1 hypothetical protein [Myxococcota bacterium]